MGILWRELEGEMLDKILTAWRDNIEYEFFKVHEEYNRRKWSIASIKKLAIIFTHYNTKFYIGIDPYKEGINSLAALALCAMHYNCYAEIEYRPHAFVWYILKNPMSDAKGVIKDLIEYIEREKNYIWLHAAPEGGDKLMLLYERLGFKKCKAKKWSILRPIRLNDGRYMYRKRIKNG